MEQTPAWFDAHYLATDDPCAQSGFTGSAARWEAARRLIARGIDAPGTLLDIGCANGLLMDSLVRWSAFPIEPYGIELAPGLAAIARRRFGDHVFHADITTWTPPHGFDFVHVRLDMLDLRDVRPFARRVIVSSDGSFRRPDSARAANVADVLRARGWSVDGSYERNDAQQVELSVAWTR